jgi:CheY-like chemotaxis protein
MRSTIASITIRPSHDSTLKTAPSSDLRRGDVGDSHPQRPRGDGERHRVAQQSARNGEEDGFTPSSQPWSARRRIGRQVSSAPADRRVALRRMAERPSMERRRGHHDLGSEEEVASMIRVVIVDDEALVRSGFTLILNATPDIRVVASATGVDALEVIKAEKPDVLLLDIRMPQVDGLTLLNVLSALPHRPAIAMLTTFDADEYVLAALNAGASGFCSRTPSPISSPSTCAPRRRRRRARPARVASPSRHAARPPGDGCRGRARRDAHRP